jgi:hypothetical protein
VLGQGEPDRVGHSLTGDPVQHGVGAPGRIGAHQHAASRTGAGPVEGQLRQCLTQDGDVVGGDVRTRDPGRSITANGSPVPSSPAASVPWSMNAHNG